jgi:hypothetical protein
MFQSTYQIRKHRVCISADWIFLQPLIAKKRILLLKHLLKLPQLGKFEIGYLRIITLW